MKRVLLTLLLAVTSAFAFFPVQVERSEAELAIQAELAQAVDSTEILLIGKRYLRNYPDDIPAGREAQKAIAPLLEDKLGFFRARWEALDNLASFYLYARATDFALPEAEVAEIVDRYPESFWSWLMFMATEWHKETPDMAVVIDRVEQAITLDGSRPEGYFFAALAYLEEDDEQLAREALEAGLLCDPLDLQFRDMLLDLYLKQRDADAYFRLMSGLLPATPLEISLASIADTETVTSDDLRGQVSLLVHWSMGSEICINNTLQEMNRAVVERQLEWPIYAMHVGDETTDASPFITDTDKAGNSWQVKFMKSTDDFNEQLSLPQRPCVYVIGPDGYVHALVNGKGHTDDLIDTVIWLADEVARRM